MTGPRTAAPRVLGSVLALLVVLAAFAPSTAEAQFHFHRGDHVRNRPAHIGLSAIGGAQFHTHTGAIDGFVMGGLDVIGTLVPGFALGFTRAGIAWTDAPGYGGVFAFDITPTFEFSFFPSSDVQLFLQLGATVSIHAPRGYFFPDAALTGVIGARFWLGNTFTFGLLVGNDIGLTNPGIARWLGGLLGQGEVTIFGGLELGWNI